MSGYKKIGLLDYTVNAWYMCPNCFDLASVTASKVDLKFKFDEYEDVKLGSISDAVTGVIKDVYCTKCGASMVQIDSNIAGSIAKLNKKGYSTLFSCGGHYSDVCEIYTPYISFGYDPYQISFSGGPEDPHIERKRLYDYAQKMKANIQQVLLNMKDGAIGTRNRITFQEDDCCDNVDVVVNNFNPAVNDDPRIILTVKPSSDFNISMNNANCLFRYFQNTLRNIVDNLPKIDVVAPRQIADLSKEDGIPYIHTIKQITKE